MVLDNLGEKLKEGLRKIARGMTIDENAINSLVKDIQRALLQADVDVSLVLDITKRIKERAMKEKDIKGLDLRGRIVNIVYEELVKFLGNEKSEIKINKNKPFKMMMVGVYGAGKCVHPDSNILLNDGSSAKIEEIYNNLSNSEDKTILEDGEIIDISNKNLLIPSFNPENLKIETKKATHLWKLKGKEFFDVKLDNGNDFSVKVTPEHPFFVLKNGTVEQIRADELDEDCYVAVPTEFPYEPSQIDFFDDLKKLDLCCYVDPKEAKQLVINKYGTIKNLHNCLVFKKNYCKFTTDIKEGKLPIMIFDKFNTPFTKFRKYGCTYPVSFPLHLNKDLSEFLGYLIGDGYLDKSYIHFSNQDKEILERINVLSKNLFGIKAIFTKEKRSVNLFYIRINSKSLVSIFNKLFNIPIGKKGKFIRIPSQIMKSNVEVLRSFIRAYFDCDASPESNARHIELTSESNNLIRDTYDSLLKFGIFSTVSRKYVNCIPYWRLTINAEYAEKYADKIGFSISYKSNKVKSYSTMGIGKAAVNKTLFPSVVY